MVRQTQYMEQGLEVVGCQEYDDEHEKLTNGADGAVYNADFRSELKRDLKTRQLAMIALGGALGTGLIVNTGPTLARVGPGSMLFGYAIVGVLCYAVMTAMGEMAAWLPLPSGFTGFANRFVDPALGFALSASVNPFPFYILTEPQYIITTPNNLIASALVIQFWFNQIEYEGPASNPAIYVTIILITIIAINYFGVGIFGEFEFALSSLKVLIMIGLMFLTLILAAGGGGDGDPKGFRYWSHPGAFAEYIQAGSTGRFLAFWSVMSSAVFSFLGAELVGVTVGEAQNPRKAIPRAVRLTFYRILIFYIVLILLLGMNVPYNSRFLLTANTIGNEAVNAEASPFVVAAQIAQVQALPSLINACILVFTFSAANSDLYIATRTLYALSVEHNAPRIFSYTNDRGVPIYALALSSALCTTAFISVHIGAFATFQYFISLVTIFGILTWISILVSHIFFIRARQAQNIPDSALVYVSPFGLRGSIAALVFCCVITLFNGFSDFVGDFDWRNFLVHYIGIPLYLAMIFGYKWVRGSQRVKARRADLFGGKEAIDKDEEEFLAEEKARRGGREESRAERWYRLTLGNLF
ncbi:Dicarboxylic amino acid permease protein [Rutstroemia sp. NJR-2017a BVV2]|nr:Dicarboxylic amino acid permease protein [Rutstroemia sp. NJR-2017a BVV2]PQE18525.1 Dicarboxylic amino acid permease protein [Rutstroemia sp. NJR-2017a BVV2]